MKKISVVIAAAALMLGLSACGSSRDGASNAESVNGGFRETDVRLGDGRELHCLFWRDGGHMGGMSCDWDNAR